jgi:predicted O-methyltransferase YrrM
MDVTLGRIIDGVRWRTDALVERLPRGAQVWLDNVRQNARVRRGHTSFERARLVRTFTEVLAILRRREDAASLGDYLEFGVYHGTSLSCMYEARQRAGIPQMRLFGFDSFEGLPGSAAAEDDGVWAPGQYKSTMGLTRANLRRWRVPVDEVTLVKGWFSDTCTPAARAQLGLEHASVIMVDCDLYSSTRQVLTFCEPLIARQAVLVFDDWHASGLAEKGMGEARAFAEFLKEHPTLSAEELQGLNYKDERDPMLFLVTRHT